MAASPFSSFGARGACTKQPAFSFLIGLYGHDHVETL